MLNYYISYIVSCLTDLNGLALLTDLDLVDVPLRKLHRLGSTSELSAFGFPLGDIPGR